MKKKLLFVPIILILLAGVLYYISLPDYLVFNSMSVSYTHLDVYKRQSSIRNDKSFFIPMYTKSSIVVIVKSSGLV